MRLQLRGHPVRRMRQRGVTQADIENAIANAWMTVQGEDVVTYFGPGMNGERLKVFTIAPGYVDESTTIIVKSLAWQDREDPA